MGRRSLPTTRRGDDRREACIVLQEIWRPVADRVRGSRRQLGMSQLELAVRSGLRLRTVIRLEMWAKPLNPSMVSQLARALSVDEDALYPTGRHVFMANLATVMRQRFPTLAR